MNKLTSFYFILMLACFGSIAEAQTKSDKSNSKWLLTMNTPLGMLSGTGIALPNGIQYLRISSDQTTTTFLTAASGIAYNISGSFYAGANIGISRFGAEDISLTTYALGPMARYYIGLGSKSSIVVGAAAQWGGSDINFGSDNQGASLSLYSGTLAYAYTLGTSSAIEVQLNYDQYSESLDSVEEVNASALSLRIGFTVFL